MRKRGKQFKRLVDPLAFNDAITKQKPLIREKVLNLAITYRDAFERLMKGMGSEADLYTFKSSMRIAMELANRGFGKEEMKFFVDADHALFRALQRSPVGFDGVGIQAMKDALELHDQQIELVSQGEMIAALRKVLKEAEHA